MACEILGNVLALSVRMSKWFLTYSRAVLSSAIAVGVCVLNANSHRVAEADRAAYLMRAQLSCDDCSFSHIELHAVRVDP